MNYQKKTDLAMNGIDSIMNGSKKPNGVSVKDFVDDKRRQTFDSLKHWRSCNLLRNVGTTSSHMSPETNRWDTKSAYLGETKARDMKELRWRIIMSSKVMKTHNDFTLIFGVAPPQLVMPHASMILLWHLSIANCLWDHYLLHYHRPKETLYIDDWKNQLSCIYHWILLYCSRESWKSCQI